MNLEIDTNTDKIISTLPEINIKMDNIQVEEQTKKDDTNEAQNSNFVNLEFIMNKSKMAPPREKEKEKEFVKDTSDSIHNGYLSEQEDRHRDIEDRYKEQDHREDNRREEPILEPMFNSGIFTSIKTSVMTEDEIRREKSFVLHQYETNNIGNRYSPKILTMESSLDEVKNELEYINTRRNNENTLKTWKDSMFFALHGIVQLNSAYDPFDADLSDWLKDTHYQLFREGKFDQVLQELILKWRGKVPITPELQLLGILGMSVGGAILTKRQEKHNRIKQQQEEELIKKQINQQMQLQMKEMQKQFDNQQAQMRRMYQGGVSEMQGPTLTPEDLASLVNQDFDTTIGEIGDDLSVSVKKRRGRPPKPKITVQEALKAVDEQMIDEQIVQEQTISLNLK